MIYYEKTGEGQPVFLIHGFPNDHHTWDAIVPKLTSSYTLYLPDLPGAGKSNPFSELMTMEDMVNAINAIFIHEKIEKAIVVGHSMGGYVAVNFAHLFPEKIIALSLVHSLASADTPQKKANREKAIALIRKGELEKYAFLRGMAQNLFSNDFMSRHPEAVISIADKGNQLSREALIGFYNAIKEREDRVDVLRRGSFPVQWVMGDEDSATPIEEGLLQAHISKVNDVVVYAPCGHMSMVEKPEKLSGDLLRFFDFVHKA